MNTIPLSCEWMHRHARALTTSQLGQLVLLLAHIVDTKQPLPLDASECRRIAGATNRDDSRALAALLERHFTITETGRMPLERMLVSTTRLVGPQMRCSDANVTTASPQASAQPNLPVVTPQDLHNSRQKRYRADIQALRDAAIAQGLTPRRHASKRELQAMLVVTPCSDAVVTQPSLQHPSRAGNTLNTNTNPNTSTHRASEDSGKTETPYGSTAIAMRSAGMAKVNPSHPGFMALVDAGAGQELVDVVPECLDASNPFAYSLAVVRGRRAAAAKAAAVNAKTDVLAQWAGPALAAKLKGGAK